MKLQYPSGSDVAVVRIEGDRRNPEPSELRVYFKGGSLSVVRTGNDEYWAHISVNHPERDAGWDSDDAKGKLVDARVDYVNSNARVEDAAAICKPDLYHLAVRIAVC